MLTGAVFGAIIVLLLMYCLYLRGANTTLAHQVKVLGAEQAAAEANLRGLATKVQEMQKPFVIALGDDQALKIANIVLTKVEAIMQSRDAAALNKLN